MGGILAESRVKISMTDLDKLDQHIDSSGHKFIGTTDKMSTGLKAMGGLFATIGVAKFAGDVFNASVQMDKYNRMLVNVEGSQAAANKRFEQFRILAKEPVLDPFNLSRFYVGLKSVNVEGDLSIRFMKSLANAMAGVGAGNEEFSRSMEQVVQMMGKATLQGQDLRTIAESFPQIRKYLAEAFSGLTDPEAIAKAGYKSIDVLTKLNEVMEKEPKFAGGAQASVDNFKQSLMLFESTLGQNVLPTITKFLDKLTELMDKFGQLDAPLKILIGTSVVGGVGLLGVAAAVTAVVNALDALGMSAGLKALTSGALAGGAKAGLGKTAGGIAIGGSALGALGAVAGATAATAWAVHEIYIAATQVNVVGPASTAGAKKEIAGSRGELLKELGLYGETQQFSTGMNPGDMVKMSNLFKQVGLDMNRYSNPSLKLTFADVISSLKTSFGQEKYITKPMNLTGLGVTGGASLSPEAQKKLDKMGDSLIEAWLSFNNQTISAYASTEAGKYKREFYPRAGARELGLIKAQPTVEYQPRYPELFQNEPLTGPQGVRLAQWGRPGMDIPGIERAGLISGLGVGVDMSKEITTKEKIWDIESKIDNEQEKIISGWSEGIDANAEKGLKLWDDFSEGIDTAKNSWLDMANTMIGSISQMAQGANQMTSSFEDLMARFGVDLGEYEYVDPKKEAERKKMQKENAMKPKYGWWKTTKDVLGIAGSILGIASGAGSLWSGISAITGFQAGGWAMTPQIARVAEHEPELIIPRSKLVSSGIGGSTIINISFPNADPDRMDKGRFKHLVATSINELVNDGVLSRSVN